MADIARSALQQGRTAIAGVTAKPPAIIRSAFPVVADVWISGRLGFVLLLHRRHDGLVGEELYYSLRSEDGVWDRPDHVSGGIVGWDTPAVEEALAGAPMSVVAESESLVHTGRAPDAGDGELVKICELLVSSDAELVEIECFSPTSPTAPTLRCLLGSTTRGCIGPWSQGFAHARLCGYLRPPSVQAPCTQLWPVKLRSPTVTDRDTEEGSADMAGLPGPAAKRGHAVADWPKTQGCFDRSAEGVGDAGGDADCDAIVLAAGALIAVYIAYRDEKLGAAIVVGATVTTVLYLLLFGNWALKSGPVSTISAGQEGNSRGGLLPGPLWDQPAAPEPGTARVSVSGRSRGTGRGLFERVDRGRTKRKALPCLMRVAAGSIVLTRLGLTGGGSEVIVDLFAGSGGLELGSKATCAQNFVNTVNSRLPQVEAGADHSSSGHTGPQVVVPRA
ncbi:hypothetical protein [Streptomyces sp. NPDC049915]|uniref:hypothetical protein n=1 Tax=Streptomyces sp. NPDC049915 TaxID=3155510 RepID=UPI003423417F